MTMLRVMAAFALLSWAIPGPALAAPAAPAFTFKRLDGGGTFDSRSLIGKQVLLIRFQASWCKVCGPEADELERTWVRYRPAGLTVVAIQVEDTEADARRFLRAHGATYPAGLDPRLQIANRFGAKGTPYTVVVNTRGEIVARIAGRVSEARLAQVLDPLLKKPSPRKPPARLQ
jgi:cytochrome c biogenesis protein CcmG/thiol:disulfide interchange protein DsbE